MTYLYERGLKKPRRMHIALYDKTGNITGEAACGIKHNFNTSINAPWALGCGVCKNCLLKLKQGE